MDPRKTFVGVLQDETDAWEKRLAILSEGLQLLNGIQQKWVYLEPIFAKGALPQEQARFKRVNAALFLSCCLNCAKKHRHASIQILTWKVVANAG